MLNGYFIEMHYIQDLEYLQLSVIISFYNANVTVCMFFYEITVHDRKTIYWCVTKNERGLINRLCWEIFTLGTLALDAIWNDIPFKYYYVHMIGKQQSYLKLDMKRCFLLRVLFWPGTCAMTEIQYLNVFGLAVWTGFTELDSCWGVHCGRWIPLQGEPRALLFEFHILSVNSYKYFEDQAAPHSDLLLCSAVILLLWRSVY